MRRTFPPLRLFGSFNGVVMEGLTVQDYWVSRVTAYNAWAALVLTVWDWLICLDQEITWIWPQPRSATYKWVYFFCRYAAFVCQIINVLFVHRMERYAQFRLSTCRLWLAYQGIVVEIFLAIVEGLLMVRVYALWGRSRRIFLLLALFLVLEVSASAVSTSVITGDTYFNQLCLFKKPPLIFVLFSVAALATQLSIIILTLYRQRPLRRSQRSALVVFVTREGSVASFTILALLIAGFVYLMLDSEYGDIMFYWVLSILSICGCRLVLNVHRFALPVSGDSDEVCFTSVCIIGQDADQDQGQEQELM